jgi:hypothetical protein
VDGSEALLPLNSDPLSVNMPLVILSLGNECIKYWGFLMLVYKVVEVNTVSEDILEEVLNEWTVKGWHFEGMQFAMRESSKRPAMAFVTFTREKEKK